MSDVIDGKINKSFRNTSDVTRELFSYLGRVREADAEDLDKIRDQDVADMNREEVSRYPGNWYNKNLVTRIPHIDSSKQAYSGAITESRASIMPGDGQRKRASFSDTLSSVGKTKLSDIEGFRRKLFVSPLLESVALGGAVGLGAYFLAPKAQKMLGGAPKYRDPETGEIMYMTPDERRNWAIGAGLGIAGLNAARGINFKDIKKSNVLTFPKRASMLGPTDFVPKSFAMNAVSNNSSLPYGLRQLTNSALSTIPGNPMINSTDMLRAGISSGASGLSGIPVGRIAAASTVDALTAYGIGSVLGVNDPSRLAKTVGIGSAVIRGLSSF